jgi:hypothetical protein
MHIHLVLACVGHFVEFFLFFDRLAGKVGDKVSESGSW